LVNDLLDLSRLQTGKLALNRQSISLSPVLAESLESVRAEAEAKQVTLDLRLPAASLIVEADTVRVQQIVWNLLSNALKFTPDGGQVTLSLEPEGGQARLVVEDTGQGISAEFLPHVFEMFRQADATPTRQHGGMGIGLALVRQLVELHGGRVEVASGGVGRGARFTVWLPLHATAPESGGAAGQGTAGELAGLRILVVDDTQDTVEVLRALLEMEGAAVETATGGAEALRLAEAQDFDLIFSDISMPGMDGYALLAELRRRLRTAGVPAVALTGFGRTKDMERARAAGFSAHLTKPISLTKLLETSQALTRPGLQTARPPESAQRARSGRPPKVKAGGRPKRQK
jgi:two-component system CheB/CheR fusion protein